LFESAHLEGEAKRLAFSACKLNNIEAKEKSEEPKSPPPDFDFDSSVVEDAERMVHDGQVDLSNDGCS
jgi:hypothetical protein